WRAGGCGPRAESGWRSRDKADKSPCRKLRALPPTILVLSSTLVPSICLHSTLAISGVLILLYSSMLDASKGHSRQKLLTGHGLGVAPYNVRALFTCFQSTLRSNSLMRSSEPKIRTSIFSINGVPGGWTKKLR